MNTDDKTAPAVNPRQADESSAKGPSAGEVTRHLETTPDLGVPEVLDLGVDESHPLSTEADFLPGRLKRILIGKPRDLADQSIFKHISLVAFLAWVGLGADGLSSSCYGPAEAFTNLGSHRYLAVFLAMAIMTTVFVISSCYTHIIEEFPSGGGGYLVASKLLGKHVGVVSGCALLVDYVLTITVSVAAAGDALFGLVDPSWGPWKVWAEGGAIFVLIVLNLRGIKESVQILLPIFLLFLVIHLILIVGSVAIHLTAAAHVMADVSNEVRSSIANPAIGLWGMFALLLHAYSLGAGTYTGIEAVSNSMPVMREPRVATAKRTMLYMACSLALTASGLMIAYLLLGIEPDSNKTMNHVLTETFVRETGLGRIGLGNAFLWTVLISEGALLVVAAQAGFIDGPRVLSNMAHDSWMPHWFANLSERLATHNGIVLMGLAAIAALYYTGGEIGVLVIMYSINVFVTFSLSMIGMCRHWIALRGRNPLWIRRTVLFVTGAVLCLSILVVTVVQKFKEGGWRTLAVTLSLVVFCFLIHRYYGRVIAKLRVLDNSLRQLALPKGASPVQTEPDPLQPTAVLLVGRFSGLGIHTMLNSIRFTPGYFRSFVFVSAGVVDSGNFKGSGAVQELRKHTLDNLEQYVVLANQLGMPATSFMTIGTDPVDDLEQLCQTVIRKFPKSVVFAGQLVFQKENWIQRLLHNQTAYSLQRRLQWDGIPMVILPTRVR
jgi:amino acid transporter